MGPNEVIVNNLEVVEYFENFEAQMIGILPQNQPAVLPTLTAGFTHKLHIEKIGNCSSWNRWTCETFNHKNP